jgi:hypothetical protein
MPLLKWHGTAEPESTQNIQTKTLTKNRRFRRTVLRFPERQEVDPTVFKMCIDHLTKANRSPQKGCGSIAQGLMNRAH